MSYSLRRCTSTPNFLKILTEPLPASERHAPRATLGTGSERGDFNKFLCVGRFYITHSCTRKQYQFSNEKVVYEILYISMNDHVSRNSWGGFATVAHCTSLSFSSVHSFALLHISTHAHYHFKYVVYLFWLFAKLPRICRFEK